MTSPPTPDALPTALRSAYLRTLIERAAPAVRSRLNKLGDLTLNENTLEALRARPLPEVPTSAAVERLDLTVDGEVEVPVRIYREPGRNGPGRDHPRPAMIAIHGGGYVMGSHLADDARFEQWIPKLHCVAVSVGYRLAPEVPYPGPLEDCYAALRWTFENADELNIDRARIGVIGWSAGGGLAAALALLARDRGELPVAFQALVYPMLDDRLTGPSSRANAPLWIPPSNQYGWRSYLHAVEGEIPGHAVPARATDLGDLPPALVTVGILDGLMDEDIDYARRLIAAGIPTDLHVFPEAAHGYDLRMADLPVAGRASRVLDDWLDAQLNPIA